MPTCMTKRPLYLMFNGPDASGSSGGSGDGTPPAQEKPTIDGEVFDFPVATAVADMTPEQKTEYWRHESKKQQALVKQYTKVGSIEDVTAAVQAKKDAEEAARAAAEAALTPEQKADQAALDNAKQTGFQQARDLFAKPALTSILAARTKRADETEEQATTRVAGVLELVDINAFIGADGSLDTTKVDTLAQSLAPSAPNGTPPAPQGGVPLHQVFGAHTPPGGDSGGSVSAYRDQAAKRFNPQQ